MDYASAVKSYRARKTGYAPGVSASVSVLYLSDGSAAAVEAQAIAAGAFHLTEGALGESGADGNEGGDGGDLWVE